ncbi:hypothetical protein [Huintestinicola sp.]|uniref:hypothetical protein n=1 Tax=Huintestinicola sp. TaxID=2981661 RepID=UPI003D7E147F
MKKKTVLLTVISAIIVLIAAGIFILLPRIQIKILRKITFFPPLRLHLKAADILRITGQR